MFMAQIINDPNADLASSLGRATGKGLATGLERLLQNKMQEIHSQKQHKSTTSGLQSLLGIDENKASQLAMLEPDILKEVVKAHVGQQQIAQHNQIKEQQVANRKSAEPYIKSLDQKYLEQKEIYPIVNRIIKTIESGGVANSAWLGPFFQNGKSQKVASDAAELVHRISQSSGGKPTNASRELVGRFKVGLDQEKEAQLFNARKLKEQIEETFKEYKAKNKLVNEVGDNYPADLQALIQKSIGAPGFEEGSQSEAQQISSQLKDNSIIDELPSAESAPEGYEFEDIDNPGKIYYVKDGKWKVKRQAKLKDIKNRRRI